MSAKRGIKSKRPVLVLPVLIAGALVVAGPVGGGRAGAEEAAETNVLRRIETTEQGIEIELRSSRPFPVRALIPVMRIGEEEFWRSRNPEDGRLDTLIFVVPPEAFDRLTAEDEVTVFFALAMTKGAEQEGERAAAVPERAGRVWSFGRLDKQRLDRKPPLETSSENTGEQ